VDPVVQALLKEFAGAKEASAKVKEKEASKKQKQEPPKVDKQ
jgi:hypothetical protein